MAFSLVDICRHGSLPHEAGDPRIFLGFLKENNSLFGVVDQGKGRLVFCMFFPYKYSTRKSHNIIELFWRIFSRLRGIVFCEASQAKTGLWSFFASKYQCLKFDYVLMHF